MISWLVSALTVVSAMVVAAAIRLAVWRQREAAHSFERRRRERMDAKTVVLTALAIEYAAVAEHLTDLAVRDVSGSLYEVGSHRGRRVAIVQTGAGNSRVAFEVERARVAFGPEVMIFVGIAGGRKDVARGDVVAADAVYDYEAGREDAEELRPRFKTYHSSHRLVQHAQRVARDGTWRSRLPGTPQAFIKPLAAGGKVIVDDRARTAKLVEQNAGDALAVEMEGFGFLQGVHASAPTEAIVVRGISDLLTGKTPEHDEMWQPIAARNAAAFAFALLDELDAG